ncbi:hypothetical protein [Nocardia sp. CA-119907]|uniref:hypothetical protein n=1 Tax=Nocardia sp. CA-119907 TaxID=3239973 RepID=UPI003D97F4A7
MRLLIVGILAVVSLVGTGCDSVIDSAMEPDVETSTSPELVKEAIEYGGWVLPANGKILLVKREIIRNRKYQIAVEMSPADFSSMLEQTRFVAAFDKLYVTSLVTTIAGPDLASSPNVQSAQDTFLSPKGKSMIREVVVDERTADTRIVHIEFRSV